jgi:DNA polymerase-3 subunit delta'
MWQTIGHQWAIDLLHRSLERNRVAQANLFTGPEGVGKTHLARAFAAALNCERDDKPCGECRSCQLIGKGGHPDVLLLEPDGARLKIDQVRDLQHTLSLSPVMGRKRVAILTGFEAATREAANALLKTLEEPSAQVVLILTASDADLLLPTIISRCRVMALRAVPEETIARALTERLGLAEEQAQLVARLSGGRPGWALRAAQDDSLLTNRAHDLDLLEELLRCGKVSRLEAAERLAKRDDLATLLALWQTWWRDLSLAALGCDDLVINMDRREAVRQAATRITAPQACATVSSLSQTQARLLKNINSRLALEVMLLKWQRVN